MEFRRITGLPPYVFATINQLRDEARHAGDDVIDLGFGNPDIPSPPDRRREIGRGGPQPPQPPLFVLPGIPNLRLAVSKLYKRRFGVELDPETEVIFTIGAKEGLSHLMWVLVGPGDTALVPTPSYPIHIYGPLFAGADVRYVRVGVGEDFLANLQVAWEQAEPKPKVAVFSFPHNPTTECVDMAWMQRIVDFARTHDMVLVHDFAYSDTYFDGYVPPSVLQVPGGKEVAVELYTLTKSFSMAGWRVAFAVGNSEVVGALTKIKSYLDYGTFQPIQIASIVALNEASEYPETVNAIYKGRRDALVDGLNRIGWAVPKPAGTMFVLGAGARALQGNGIARFRQVPRDRGPCRYLARRRFRRRGRGLRAVRLGGKRTTDHTGRAQPAPGPDQARLAPWPWRWVWH